MADHPLWDQLRNIWQRVSDSLGFGQKRREREQRRQNNRRAAEQALNDLWPKLGEEAKRRLAQHHATMIVCADREETRIWSKHLAEHFGGQPTGKEVGFVQWARTPENLTIAILVWHPGGGVDPSYSVAHEIGHLVDRDKWGQRLSQTQEFQAVLSRDLDAMVQILPKDPSVHAEVRKKPSEAFSWTCALAWLMPKQFEKSCPHLADYLRGYELG